jgi:hypothetical protein
MNDFLKEIGRSYLVSSLLPSSLFLPIGFIVFYDLLPQALFNKITELNLLWGQNWFLFVVLIFWVGFFLYSSFQSIIELYIGDWLPSKMRQRMRLKSGEQFMKLLQNYYLACFTPEDISLDESKKRLSQLRPQALLELGTLGLDFPVPADFENFSQTRIGNVFQSSAVYIKDRYNINGKVMWSRIVHVFPASFLKNLEEKSNFFLFLLNSSFLAGALGIIGILAGILKLVVLLIDTFVVSGFPLDFLFGTLSFPLKVWNLISQLFNRTVIYTISLQINACVDFLLVGAGFILLAYILYRLATNAAEDYSQIVCSGFDLYRRELLSQMGILPDGKYFSDEKLLWGILSEYMVAGNTLGVKEIDFLIKDKDKKKEQEFHPEQTVF